MFFGEERIKHVQEMILSAGEYKRLEKRIEDVRRAAPQGRRRRAAGWPTSWPRWRTILPRARKGYLGSLEALLPLQRDDFAGCSGR
jgi:hypothetical protein